MTARKENNSVGTQDERRVEMIAVDWGVAQKNARREVVCGDAYVMAERGDECLWAVIDGAGHGRGAHVVAAEAAALIRTHAFERALEEMIRQIHEMLRGRRGVAVSLLRLRLADARLEFVGVGNVELRSHGPTGINPVPVAGILGRALRRLKRYTYTVQPGDFLALFSDGISSRFSIDRYAMLPAAQAAQRIVTEQHKPIDDGTCVALRVIESAR
jgi:negative regulator of sigma-B (phosphoserine phosphatase)